MDWRFKVIVVSFLSAWFAFAPLLCASGAVDDCAIAEKKKVESHSCCSSDPADSDSDSTPADCCLRELRFYPSKFTPTFEFAADLLPGFLWWNASGPGHLFVHSPFHVPATLTTLHALSVMLLC